MSIEWFRDLVIIIFSLVTIVVLIFVAVLSYSVYRRLKSILDSQKATSRKIQEIAAYVGDEVVKPVIEAAALIQGVHKGIDTITELFRKRKGGGHV